jgi:hypothetical protein
MKSVKQYNLRGCSVGITVGIDLLSTPLGWPQVITSTIRGAAMLVLLMEWIYEICPSDGLRCHDIHTKSHNDRFRHSSNIKGITSKI